MHTNENIQNPYTYETTGPTDQLGRMTVAVTTAAPSVTKQEVQRLAPAVEDWDRTLFARDIAHHAMVMAEVSQS